MKTSTKGKENFHISVVKLIWLIKQKALKAILRLKAVQISRVKNIEFLDVKTSRKREDQATKGLRGMPRYMAPKKDVISCEKLR